MSKPKFLFVNKDSSSTSFSNSRTEPLAYSQINRHAQKSVKRQLPVRRKKGVATSTSRLVGWQKPAEQNNQESEPKEDEVAIIEREEDYFLCPPQIIDSFCNPTVSLDFDKQNILHYFNEVWMPSKGRIPLGCQVTGFTPIWPHDRQLSLDVVRGALQSENEVSMYALLTASTRRMRMIEKINYADKNLPDFYALKAVQALRNFITSGARPSERLVLDMSYLVLAELYVRSPSRSEVYWKMTRNLIVNCGGLGKIGPFTAQAALAYDFFIACGTLTTPALNPFEHPSLLNVETTPEVPSYDIRTSVLNRLRHLDPRIQVLSEESDRLSQTIKAVHGLPEAAVSGMLPYFQDPGRHLYALLSAPFLPSATGIQAQIVSQACIKADALAVHVRFHTYMIWLWYCALDCIGDSAEPEIRVQAPHDVLGEVSKLWKYIDRIYSMLENTGWAMQDHVILWISAVGALVSTSEIDRCAYVGLLVKTASSLTVTSKGKLKGVLDKHLPLDRLHRHPTFTLWNMIVENQATSMFEDCPRFRLVV